MDMQFAFRSRDLVLVMEPRNSKLGVTYNGPCHFVKYLTRSYLQAEVKTSDGCTTEVSLSQLKQYCPTIS